MIYHDDILDKRFSDELYSDLLKCPWYADNIANRHTFPYGEKGTHLLLGTTILNLTYPIFKKDVEENIVKKFLGLFEHLCQRFNKRLRLKAIDANLQFKGLDGSFHVDGADNEEAFILLLCNEILDKESGGQFINETQDSIVDFKHGRIIEFKASDSHKGLAFNTPYVPRISVKFYAQNLDG